MQKSIPSIVVLISGRGSNLLALMEYAQQTAHYEIAAVISNKPGVQGLLAAEQAGIPTRVVDHTQFAVRDHFDEALKLEIDKFSPDWVALAGFMRVLTPGFVEAFQGRLVNIHPSLLPAFPGLHTHERALAAGVRVHGATVHLVTAQLDHGPILDQAVLQVESQDTPDRLAQRVLALEHVMYPRALANLASGRLSAYGQEVRGVLNTPLIHQIQQDS